MISEYIKNFLDNNISFYDLKDKIDVYLSNEQNEILTTIFNELNSFDFEEYSMELSMIVLVYIWIIPNSFNKSFKPLDKDDSFIPFIKDVRKNYSNELNGDTIYINKQIDYMMIKVNTLLFIIQFNDDELDISLPNDYSNRNLYCVNCGDEIEVEEYITLYGYDFYILEKCDN